MMKSFRKAAISITFLIIVTFCLPNLVLWFFESQFVFKPMKYPIGNWHPQKPLPEDAWIISADGQQIHGWYFSYKHPKVILLYLHGNIGNVTSRYDEITQLHDKLSASVLNIDYRGFGKSKGQPTEQSLIKDAEAARIWLANKEHIKPDQIILIGRSMGGGVAVDLASRLKVKGLILISTFTSLPDAVSYHYPMLAAHFIMHNRFNSIDKIKFYSGPLLSIHGDADTVVPLQQGKKLFASAKGKKWFIQIPNGEHFDPLPLVIYPKIDEYIKQML